MPVVPVATTYPNDVPTVGLDHLDDLTDFAWQRCASQQIGDFGWFRSASQMMVVANGYDRSAESVRRCCRNQN
jgi:hypothetical protein